MRDKAVGKKPPKQDKVSKVNYIKAKLSAEIEKIEEKINVITKVTEASIQTVELKKKELRELISDAEICHKKEDTEPEIKIKERKISFTDLDETLANLDTEISEIQAEHDKSVAELSLYKRKLNKQLAYYEALNQRLNDLLDLLQKESKEHEVKLNQMLAQKAELQKRTDLSEDEINKLTEELNAQVGELNKEHKKMMNSNNKKFSDIEISGPILVKQYTAEPETDSDFKQDVAGSETGSDFKQDVAGSESDSDFKQDVAGSEADSDFKQDVAGSETGPDLKHDIAGSETGSDFKQNEAWLETGSDFKPDVAVDEIEPRVFTEEQIHELQDFASNLSQITQRLSQSHQVTPKLHMIPSTPPNSSNDTTRISPQGVLSPELQITPLNQELQITPLSQELQITPLSQELQITPLSQELQIPPLGTIITQNDDLISLEQAKLLGLITKSDTFEEEEEKPESKLVISLTTTSSISSSQQSSSVESELNYRDVEYLKRVFGKSVSLALAEMIAVQPSDPIHYLGHWFIKYRYNQEIDEAKLHDIQALMIERQNFEAERWHRELQEEAYLAVLEAVFRAERIIMHQEYLMDVQEPE